MRTRCLITFLMVALIAGAAGAQTGQGGLIPIRNRTYIAINPLLIPFDIGSVELESGVAPGVTVGGVASYAELDSDRYTTFDLKVKYYPAEVVLRGFSVGLSAGFLGYSTPVDISSPNGTVTRRESLNSPTVGLVVDYNWMLGPSRRFVVGTGLGAKRVMASREDRDRVDLDRAYATARFVLGYAF